MRFPFLARHLLLFLLIILPQATQADHVKVALIDNEPVYHWTNFPSAFRDDVDRALILRDFRRQGFHLSKHFVDEALQKKVNRDYAGVRAKLLKDLKTHRETIASYREFTEEEIILEAMLVRETKRPKNGHPPPTRDQWLASLHAGTRIRTIKMSRGKEH